MQGQDISTMPQNRPKWIVQAEEVLIPSWTLEFRIIGRLSTENTESLKEIMDLWEWNAQFNMRRSCPFDSIIGMAYRPFGTTNDIDVITWASAIIGDIKKTAEMRHPCARIVSVMIIRGFLTHIDDGDWIRVRNHFIAWKRQQEQPTADSISIDYLTQKFDATTLSEKLLE